MRDVDTVIWCLLDDGPAAGVVAEMRSDTVRIIVTMEGGAEIHYALVGDCEQHRIARYRCMQDIVQGNAGA